MGSSKGDPGRAYRGLEPLEAADAADAAVFFGRDVEILQGLDTLRGMRASGRESLFVILGASGAGKSSFLRAGLLPRLARDDRHFFALRPIRPENSPLHGEHGLARSIFEANSRLDLQPRTLGDVKAAIGGGPARVAGLLADLRNAARERLLSVGGEVAAPTLVLPVDQAEELFNAGQSSTSESVGEARSFLQLIGGVLREGLVRNAPDQTSPLIVAFTIRSDRYAALQTDASLAGLADEWRAARARRPGRWRPVLAGRAPHPDLESGRQRAAVGCRMGDAGSGRRRFRGRFVRSKARRRHHGICPGGA